MTQDTRLCRGVQRRSPAEAALPRGLEERAGTGRGYPVKGDGEGPLQALGCPPPA